MAGNPNPISQITSIKDPRVVQARALTSVTARLQKQRFLIYGEEALQWAIKAGINIEFLFCTPAAQEVYCCLPQGCEICLVSEGILKKISGTSYLVPVLAIGVQNQSPFLIPRQPDLLLVLDNIQDHGNIGTIIRTASAFGIKDVQLCNMQTDLYSRKTVDASRGMVFGVRSDHYQNTRTAVMAIKKAGYQVIATTPHGSALQSGLKLKAQPTALILGNESHGIEQEILQLADACIQIPMQPNVESLNVGVAAGISIYELKMKVVFAMLTQKIRATLGREINVTSRVMMQKLNLELIHLTDRCAVEAIFLMRLTCDRQMTLSEISRDTALFGDELKIFLAPLQQNGWILPPIPPAIHWRISEAGEKWLAQIWPLVERAEKKALTGFSEEEIHLFTNFLHRIQDNCAEEILILISE